MVQKNSVQNSLRVPDYPSDREQGGVTKEKNLGLIKKEEDFSEKDVNMQENTATVPLGYKERKEQKENRKGRNEGKDAKELQPQGRRAPFSS